MVSDNIMSYCIIQFSPRPERFEYMNVGVLVFDRKRLVAERRLSENFARVRKFFDEAQPSFLKLALQDYADRVIHEYRANSEAFNSDTLNGRSAGIFRVTRALPVMGDDARALADALFLDLVEAAPTRRKVERVNSRLTTAFKDAGVLSLLERKPRPVLIEKWGVSIKADYGYQNGVYNLIDAARFDDGERGLAEAGKRVLEGHALAQTLKHRLIVVGDFNGNSSDFVENVRGEFEEAGAKLFTLDEVDDLAVEIRKTAH